MKKWVDENGVVMEESDVLTAFLNELKVEAENKKIEDDSNDKKIFESIDSLLSELKK
jgi:hypothetical protein